MPSNASAPICRARAAAADGAASDRRFAGIAERQASILAYADVFRDYAIFALTIVCLAFLLRRKKIARGPPNERWVHWTFLDQRCNKIASPSFSVWWGRWRLDQEPLYNLSDSIPIGPSSRPDIMELPVSDRLGAGRHRRRPSKNPCGVLCPNMRCQNETCP